MSNYSGSRTGAEIDDAVGVVKGANEGICVKTGTGDGVRRSIAVDTNFLAVANGSGEAGNPTLDFASGIKTKIGNYDTHIADDTKHRLINDSAATATVLWSGEKITAELKNENLGTAITGTTGTITDALAGQFVVCNNANTITITINTGELNAGESVELFQQGAGKIVVVRQSTDHQEILNAQIRSTGPGQSIRVVCTDDTGEAEKYVVVGGEAND